MPIPIDDPDEEMQDVSQLGNPTQIEIAVASDAFFSERSSSDEDDESVNRDLDNFGVNEDEGYIGFHSRSPIVITVPENAFFSEEDSSDDEHVDTIHGGEVRRDEGGEDGTLEGNLDSFRIFDSALNLSEDFDGPVGNQSLRRVMNTDQGSSMYTDPEESGTEWQDVRHGENRSLERMDTDQFSFARNLQPLPEMGNRPFGSGDFHPRPEMGDHSSGSDDHQEAASDKFSDGDDDDSSADTHVDEVVDSSETSSFHQPSSNDSGISEEDEDYTVDSLMISLLDIRDDSLGGGQNEGDGHNVGTIGEIAAEGESDSMSDVITRSPERRDESMRLVLDSTAEAVDEEDHDDVIEPARLGVNPELFGFLGGLNNVNEDALQVMAGTRGVFHPGAPRFQTLVTGDDETLQVRAGTRAVHHPGGPRFQIALTNVDDEDQHSMSPIPFVDEAEFHEYQMDDVVRGLMGDFLALSDHPQAQMEDVEVAVHPASLPDLDIGHVNLFPESVSNSGEDGGNGTSKLDTTILKMDGDSIVHMADCLFSMLQFFGKGGTGEFRSAVNRIHTSDSCRIAVDYHGASTLQPAMYGRKVWRLKVVSLDHFPNIHLLSVTKDDIKFSVCLHVLEPARVTDQNRVRHEILLTLICALNLAIDGKIPYEEEDREYGLEMERRYRDQWLQLPYFELQDNSNRQKKKIHSCMKYMQVEAVTGFFFRVQRALQLMASTPNVIDEERQSLNVDEYWSDRQAISFGGSGQCLSLDQLGTNAGLLSENTIAIATSAGCKKIFRFEDMEKEWNGSEESANVNGDQSLLLESWTNYQRRQFSSMKTKLEEVFPGLKGDLDVSGHVLSFVDVGIEMRPVDKSHVLLPHIGRSKAFLSAICAQQFPDDVALASAESDHLDALSDHLDPEVNVQDSGDQVEVIPTFLQANYVDRLQTVQRVNPASYPMHFTTTHGNVHTGSLRMNAVSATDENFPLVRNGKVMLEHATRSMAGGGQNYSPYIRINTMKQQRPEFRKDLPAILSHCINILRNECHLVGTSIEKSIEIVADLLEKMNEVYHHSELRTENATSNVVRTEFFLFFNNWPDNPDEIPIMDPTSTVDEFSKEDLDSFESVIIKTHLDPINQFLGGIRAAMAEGRSLELDKFSGALKTRVIGSLEILLQNLCDTSINRFVIQNNLRGMESNVNGMTVDIPPCARVPLSEREVSLTGFQYGIMTSLLPLMKVNRTPPSTRSQVTEEDHSSKFPPYHSLTCRSVVKSLVMGLDVGKFEQARAHVDTILHSHSHRMKGTGEEEPDVWGVMDVIDFDPFVTMSMDDRSVLLSDLARLLLTYYCHTTWKVSIKRKIYGDDAHNTPLLDDNLESVSMNDFDIFPFTESKVIEINQYLENGGKFRKMRPFLVTSTGKL